MRFMVPTTKTSPITVIIVVDVVGVNPNAHTSDGLPVYNSASASFAKTLSAFPVITIIFISVL